MMRPTRKHHYLPRHYLDGFTNGKGNFFVYDKQADRIFSSNPGASFFENNLNTVTLPPGNTSDFMEELYTYMENRFWGSLDRIRNSTHKTHVELADKMHLFLFLSFLYWRLPCNVDYAEKLSENAFIDGNEFDYFRISSKTSEPPPEEIVEIIRNSEAFKKSFKLIIPFAPFYKDKDWARRMENWRLLYTADARSWYIVGDSPIITRSEDDRDFVTCLKEFVFPVSGKILLINTLKPPTKEIMPPGFVIDFNAAVIQRAYRFVACQDRRFLELIIGYYKHRVQKGNTESIIPEMYAMLQ
ncbi:MAG: DUF4238 domain-containing protein [Dehalococcoidia bacterium]|jgi:hypothetical protein